jgi:hypothetical protein
MGRGKMTMDKAPCRVSAILRGIRGIRKRYMLIAIIPVLLVLVNVMLSPNHHLSVRGTVVDDAGQPMADVKIGVLRTYDSSALHLPVPFTGSAKEERFYLKTDASGKFEVSGRGIGFIIFPTSPGWHAAPETPQQPYHFATEASGVDRIVVYKMLKGPAPRAR